jgi:hypothetical protein
MRLLRSLRLLAMTLCFLALFTSAYAAEQGAGETAKLFTTLRPPPKPVTQDKIYMDANYEMSDVMIGANTGHWIEFVNTFGYFHDKFFSYFYTDQYDRLNNKDYTANLGSYVTIDENQNAHFEMGWGWAVDYIYKLQMIMEYSHRLYKSLFWQVGWNYRDNKTGTTNVIYPGFIYYFGDNYISGNWGTNIIEGRNIGYTGSFKGDFKITDIVHYWMGVAFGERLYDVYGLPKPSAEYGYILFNGLTFTIFKDISAKVGLSYGYENPKFIKRSLYTALAVKF